MMSINRIYIDPSDYSGISEDDDDAISGVVASTTQTIAGGTPILHAITRVTTVANSGDAVTLPLATDGDRRIVMNKGGGNSLKVFPAVSSHRINALSLGAAYELPSEGVAEFICAEYGTWDTTLTEGVGVPPSNLVAPSVITAATVGGYAAMLPGSWSGNPTSYKFQIKRDGVAVGAPLTSSYRYVEKRYTFVTADMGHVMTADVTALNGAGEAIAAQTIALGAPTYDGVYGSSLYALLASWSAGGTTITANNATAPDGATTAMRVLATVANSGHNVAATNLTKGAVVKNYRFKFYAKPIGDYQCALIVDDGTSTNRVYAMFNIQTGADQASVTNGSGFEIVRQKTTAADNGFYECEVFLRVSTTRTTVAFRVALEDPSFTAGSFAGDITKGIYLWEPRAIESVLPTTGPLAAVPKIIFDTVMTSDDSFDAFYYLCKKQAAGGSNLLAATIESSNPYSAPCLRAMLDFGGLTSVPVGSYQGDDRDTNDGFPGSVRNRFRPGDTRANYSTALVVARTALAAQADNSVTYICAAGLGNLKDLLDSPADSISSLSGMDLVAAKVRRLVLMGGNSPTGSEHNFQLDPAATAYVMLNWPTEIVAVPYDMLTVYCCPPIGYDPLVDPFGYAFDLLNPVYYASKSGVVSLAIGAGGSGGTNGTYDLAFSGGGGNNALGTFTVSGGAITSVKLLAPGFDFTSNPTVSTAACPGLTGATVNATYGAYNTRSAWDGVAAYIAVEGFDDTNFRWEYAPGDIVVNSSTGDNTVTELDPYNGKQVYLDTVNNNSVAKTVAGLINRVVFS